MKQVVSSPLQQLHARLSPKRSTSKTIPSAPRTFSDILSWPEFVSEACQLEGSLDDAIHQYALPTVTMQAATGISSAADESEVRGAIMSFLYSINEAAKLLGIGVECVGGGSGRSSSFTDLVVRRTGQPTSPSQLSLLILGAGEVKGIWQLSLQPGETLEVVLRDPTRIDAFLLALQQATACHPCFFVDCEISPDMLICAWKVLLRLQPLKCSVALTTHNTCLYWRQSSSTSSFAAKISTPDCMCIVKAREIKGLTVEPCHELVATCHNSHSCISSCLAW